MNKVTLTALTALIFLAGCTSIQSVSLTSIPAKKGKPVRAEISKTIFLGFNFNNDFVDELSSDLKRQCENGIVTGILTKDEIVDYFLMIVHSRRITATGYCLTADLAAAKAPARKSASDNHPNSSN